MIEAARAADVNKIVVLSSLGTVLHPRPIIGSAIAQRDEVFHNSGLDIAYLRAGGFMSNAVWWADTIRDEGRVYDSTDPGRIGVVDNGDIARVAALALTEEGHAGHAYTLTGPEALTAREQTKILANVLGRPINFVDVTPEQFERTSIETGMPERTAHAVRDLNELFRAGRAGVLSDDIKNLTGTAPRTFDQWCAAHPDMFT